LLGVLSVELLLFDLALVEGAGVVVENDDGHGVVKGLRIYEVDLEATFTDFVVLRLSAGQELL
jgi:hypothetical protein